MVLQIHFFCHVFPDNHALNWWIHDCIGSQQDQHRSTAHYASIELRWHQAERRVTLGYGRVVLCKHVDQQRRRPHVVFHTHTSAFGFSVSPMYR